MSDKNKEVIEKEINRLEMELACNEFLGLLERSRLQNRIDELEELLKC